MILNLPTHVIWMDVRFPCWDGLEAASRIRQLEDRENVKILAVTSSDLASQREKFLEAGFDRCLRKPYGPSEIYDCLARDLGVRYRYRAEPKAADADPPVAWCDADLATVGAELRDCLVGRKADRTPCLPSLGAEPVARLCAGASRR
jgi:CheY-like chemotaxis protein